MDIGVDTNNSDLGYAVGLAWAQENKPHNTHPFTAGTQAALMAALAGLAQFKVGGYAGTGASLDVSLGFTPKAVIITGDDATPPTQPCIGLHFGHTAAKGIKVVDSGAGTTDISVMSSNGITLGTKKFTVGTDANLNENGKNYKYVAIG